MLAAKLRAAWLLIVRSLDLFSPVGIYNIHFLHKSTHICTCDHCYIIYKTKVRFVWKVLGGFWVFSRAALQIIIARRRLDLTRVVGQCKVSGFGHILATVKTPMDYTGWENDVVSELLYYSVHLYP